MEQNNQVLKIIKFFFKPYRGWLAILIILAILTGILEAANIAAVYPILSTAFQTSFGEGNIILSTLKAMAGWLPIQSEFVAYCIIFLVTALLSFIVKYLAIKYRVEFCARLIGDSQIKVFHRFVQADYQYFIDHKQGELLYNVSTAPQRLSSIAMSVTDLISQAIMSISILIVLVTLSWQGTLGVIVIGLGYHYFTRYLGNKVSYYSGKGEMEAIRENTVVLNETITGIKQVKVFAASEERISRFTDTLQKRWYHFIRRNIWQQIPTPGLTLILYICIGIIAILIKVIAPYDFVELIPAFGTFAFAVFRLIPTMGNIGNITMSIMASLPDCETVYNILNKPTGYIIDGQQEFKTLKAEIEFNNVSFSYKGRENTLRDISVRFEKGKTTAIVGRSGSGKSTILNLMLRLFEPTNGDIKIDGLKIGEYKLASLLNKIGYVSQDTFIFNDTVKQNITFYSNHYTDDEVIDASRYAQAHDFISEMPEGYNTIVGDRGMRLSGGQAQRIAVARAMVRKPDILIFDEATNALDTISEAAVQSAIDRVAKDHTVIIVAHRLSTVANADKIIVLGDGQVLEEGTHQELMDKKGAYWELYRSQPL